MTDKPRAFVYADKDAIEILHRAGYRIVRTINPHPDFDGDTILQRAARCYLAGSGNYSRDALERALLGLRLDPTAPWRSAESPVAARTDESGTRPPDDPHDIQHGDTWEVRGRRATVVASNRWPPPKPGTHESDLRHKGAIPLRSLWRDTADVDEYVTAARWSRANHPEGPA